MHYTICMKTFVTKDNRKILISFTSEDNVKYIKALDYATHSEIGYLTFKMQKGNKAYLWSIKVSDEKYLQSGVGSIMLKCFETYCKAKRVDFIEGRYYPDDKGGKYAKGFYDNHNYSFVRDGYEQYIFKPLYKYEVDKDYLLTEDNINLNPDTDGKDAM